jgi:hypothetical protein
MHFCHCLSLCSLWAHTTDWLEDKCFWSLTQLLGLPVPEVLARNWASVNKPEEMSIIHREHHSHCKSTKQLAAHTHTVRSPHAWTTRVTPLLLGLQRHQVSNTNVVMVYTEPKVINHSQRRDRESTLWCPRDNKANMA